MSMNLRKKLFLMLVLAGLSLSMVQVHAMGQDSQSSAAAAGNDEPFFYDSDEDSQEAGDSKEDAEGLALLSPEQIKKATDKLWEKGLRGIGISPEERVRIVRESLDAGADFQSKRQIGGWNLTALEWAIGLVRDSSAIDIVKLLLSKGANVQVTNFKNQGVLQNATSSLLIEDPAGLVEILLQHGCDPNDFNQQVPGPLAYATGLKLRGDRVSVKLLLRAGADETLKPHFEVHQYGNKTAFECASNAEMKNIYHAFGYVRQWLLQKHLQSEIAREVITFLFPQYKPEGEGLALGQEWLEVEIAKHDVEAMEQVVTQRMVQEHVPIDAVAEIALEYALPIYPLNDMMTRDALFQDEASQVEQGIAELQQAVKVLGAPQR